MNTEYPKWSGTLIETGYRPELTAKTILKNAAGFLLLTVAAYFTLTLITGF